MDAGATGLQAIEAGLDPDLMARLRAVAVTPGQPLIAVDADEVLVELSAHLRRWLPAIGYRLELTRYQLEGSIFPEGSDVPLPFDDCLVLIDRFFDSEVLHQRSLPGAPEALGRLSNDFQVVVLTNVPDHGGELRRQNLAGLGMGYPMVVNSGGKGRALAWLAAKAQAPAVFIDDSLKQHESAARRAPEVTRIHFVGASLLSRILPESPAVHHRVEGWEACEVLVSSILTRATRA
ncbi:MAG: hypothetical protein OEN23_15795 [Paracoccaceae bacterium]|nr:hypothetical protein [Paracoccaceae bacterium]